MDLHETDVRFQIFTAVKIKVFWVVTPCSVVVIHQRFRRPCSLHLEGDMTSHQYFNTCTTPWKLPHMLPPHAGSTGCQIAPFLLPIG